MDALAKLLEILDDGFIVDSDFGWECPTCNRHKTQGHTESCRLGKAIDKARVEYEDYRRGIQGS